MGYTIKSKQEQIEALESANTSLQTYCDELEIANQEFVNATIEMQNKIINDKCNESLDFQVIIESLKETDQKSWFILYKSMQE